jgi:CBS domain-containing protein
MAWKASVKASDLMTHGVISVTPETGIVHAIRLMLRNHVSGLPVIDHDGKLVGMLTESDFLRRSEIGTERKRSAWFDALFGPAESAGRYVRSHGLKVRDVMTGDPTTVPENAPLDQVVRLMEAKAVRRLPVMRRHKIVGIVSRADLMRGLATARRVRPRASMKDSLIRNRILAEIARQSWAAGAAIDVVVRNGIVELWGDIVDTRQRKALGVLVENTPSVRRSPDLARYPVCPVPRSVGKVGQRQRGESDSAKIASVGRGPRLCGRGLSIRRPCAVVVSAQVSPLT